MLPTILKSRRHVEYPWCFPENPPETSPNSAEYEENVYFFNKHVSDLPPCYLNKNWCYLIHMHYTKCTLCQLLMDYLFFVFIFYSGRFFFMFLISMFDSQHGVCFTWMFTSLYYVLTIVLIVTLHLIVCTICHYLSSAVYLLYCVCFPICLHVSRFLIQATNQW